MNVSGMFLQNIGPEGLEFSPKDEKDLRFIIKPLAPYLEEDASAYRRELICKVLKSYPATKDQLSFVSSFNKDRVMLRTADDIILPFGELIAEDGAIDPHFTPTRNLCPSDIGSLLENVESELSSKANRILELLRWRQFCVAPVEVQSHGSLYWKVGEGDYPFAPPKKHINREVTIQMMKGIHWSNEHSNDLQELWEREDCMEPLGHTLLREASMLALESPRSSILIMTAALETAVKMHISKISSDTAWLMQEIQSPPIFKILRDYIPQIHKKHGNELKFWDNVKPSIKKVQNLIEVRNKVAHTGKIPNDAESLETYLKVVSDFLYLMDVLDGHVWAKTLVSKELRKKLNWPNPKDPSYQLTIYV